MVHGRGLGRGLFVDVFEGCGDGVHVSFNRLRPVLKISKFLQVNERRERRRDGKGMRRGWRGWRGWRGDGKGGGGKSIP